MSNRRPGSSMSTRSIIDSHIHLWPERMSNEHGHRWMTPGMPLAHEHLLARYSAAAQPRASSAADVVVEGVVYVESDVRYDSPSAHLETWARGPLDEIEFLRDIVTGTYGDKDAEMLLAIVAWAPMDQPTEILREWLRLAEETAGPETWKRVKGFRFLLQAIKDPDAFQALVLSAHFIHNLQLLGQRGFAFDVGVDQHSGGVWQLELVSRAMATAHLHVPEHEKATFVLDHLCKPDFVPNGPEFDRWSAAIERMSALSRTYVKLSGAFGELPDPLAHPAAIAAHIRPWVERVFTSFGPRRVLFGSDWPVCNVRGPAPERAWAAWKDVVALLLDHRDLGLHDDHKCWVWKRAAIEAYRIR